MIRRESIVEEIRRTALENGGVPLGQQTFFRETGIRATDWRGKYWARWGDTLQEAGFSPNQLQPAYDAGALLDKLADFIREVDRIPADTDLRLKRRTDGDFPSHNTFRRFGLKPDLLQAVARRCDGRPGYEDVVRICSEHVVPDRDGDSSPRSPAADGFVYMIKSRRSYKVGKTNAAVRRERELAIQLPEKSTTVHVIRTDDPAGIEAYWHKRSEPKRRNGEWFELDASDVASFKRRKFQ